MDYELKKGNIATISADAIVLPANTMLKEGPGASTALFEAAGRKKLTKYCEKIGSCPIGNAVPTPAFELNAKYIIHAVVPKWIDGQHDEYNMLCAAYLSALELADYMECKTIAFPLLCAGNNGFDLDLAFDIATECFDRFRGENLENIILVIYGYRIDALLREKGYKVNLVPDSIKEIIDVVEKKERAQHLAEKGKNVARLLYDDMIEKALNWIEEKKNREALYEMAVNIVRIVLSHGRSEN